MLCGGNISKRIVSMFDKMSFVKSWREIVLTIGMTMTVSGTLGTCIYKNALADAVTETAEAAATEIVEKRLKPIQADIQKIKSKIDDIENEFDTVNSQQAHTLDGIQFIKEILIEQDEVTYKKVKKKRDLRNN